MVYFIRSSQNLFQGAVSLCSEFKVLAILRGYIVNATWERMVCVWLYRVKRDNHTHLYSYIQT